MKIETIILSYILMNAGVILLGRFLFVPIKVIGVCLLVTNIVFWGILGFKKIMKKK
jgi:hypothetical protein